jgi:C4-dicarboxylate-specific signal transduction histidine kinase
MTEIRDILEDIALDDKRAGDVIGRLRSLLKKGDLQPRPVNLGEVVGEVLDLLHSDLIQRRVSVSTQLAPSLPPILGDRVQLQQVLLNLVLNACDAMANQPPRDRRITIAETLTPRGAVQLSVRDEGPGVAEERLELIFEPFVTTKEAGLGLGLAICRSIVAAHGGRLWAVNAPEGGTTFIMELDPIEVRSTPAPELDHHSAGGFKPAGTP